MNRAAIYHRPDSEFAYLVKPDLVQIRLRAAKDDLQRLELCYGDPYEFQGDRHKHDSTWVYQIEQMSKVATTADSDYFQAEVKLPHKRMSYFFVLTDSQGEKLIFTDKGLMSFDEKLISEKYGAFVLPFFHEIDAYQAPEWVKSTVWYQIFPERFANGDLSNDPENVKDWENYESLGRQDFFGGDLQGIIDHLDHLTELGVNGLYLTPIFKATSNHKYDTIDYLEIDPHFGDKATFNKLVEACHERGIKVMLDAVFNHIGDQSAKWQDVLEKQEASHYADWFHVNSWPASYSDGRDFEEAATKSYETFAFTPHMPKINTANPEVQEYLLQVAEYWIREFDIDAWRLDVANEVDHQFWKLFRKRCEAAKKDFYIVGEVWHSAQPWLQGDEFTAVMNYAYTDAILDFFVRDKISLKTMASQISQQLMLYRDGTNAVMFNILDSHDTERLLYLCGEDMDRFKQVEAFTYLQPGEPCIYYGDEIGLSGGADPDCRRPMPWDLKEHNAGFFYFFRDLVALRRENAELLTGGKMDWLLLSEENGLIQMRRKLGEKELIGTFNVGKGPVLLDLGEIRLSNLAKSNGNQTEIAAKGFVISETEMEISN